MRELSSKHFTASSRISFPFLGADRVLSEDAAGEGHDHLAALEEAGCRFAVSDLTRRECMVPRLWPERQRDSIEFDLQRSRFLD